MYLPTMSSMCMPQQWFRTSYQCLYLWRQRWILSFVSVEVGSIQKWWLFVLQDGSLQPIQLKPGESHEFHQFSVSNPPILVVQVRLYYHTDAVLSSVEYFCIPLLLHSHERAPYPSCFVPDCLYTLLLQSPPLPHHPTYL